MGFPEHFMSFGGAIFNFIFWGIIFLVISFAIMGFEKVYYSFKYPDWPGGIPRPEDINAMDRAKIIQMLKDHHIETDGLPAGMEIRGVAIDLLYRKSKNSV